LFLDNTPAITKAKTQVKKTTERIEPGLAL